MRYFFFQAEDGIRDTSVTGVQTCALPICRLPKPASHRFFAKAMTPSEQPLPTNLGRLRPVLLGKPLCRIPPYSIFRLRKAACLLEDRLHCLPPAFGLRHHPFHTSRFTDLPSSALLPRQNRRLLLDLAREDTPKRYGLKNSAGVAH